MPAPQTCGWTSWTRWRKRTKPTYTASVCGIQRSPLLREESERRQLRRRASGVPPRRAAPLPRSAPARLNRERRRLPQKKIRPEPRDSYRTAAKTPSSRTRRLRRVCPHVGVRSVSDLWRNEGNAFFCQQRGSGGRDPVPVTPNNSFCILCMATSLFLRRPAFNASRIQHPIG